MSKHGNMKSLIFLVVSDFTEKEHWLKNVSVCVCVRERESKDMGQSKERGKTCKGESGYLVLFVLVQ